MLLAVALAGVPRAAGENHMYDPDEFDEFEEEFEVPSPIHLEIPPLSSNITPAPAATPPSLFTNTHMHTYFSPEVPDSSPSVLSHSGVHSIPGTFIYPPTLTDPRIRTAPHLQPCKRLHQGVHKAPTSTRTRTCPIPHQAYPPLAPCSLTVIFHTSLLGPWGRRMSRWLHSRQPRLQTPCWRLQARGASRVPPPSLWRMLKQPLSRTRYRNGFSCSLRPSSPRVFIERLVCTGPLPANLPLDKPAPRLLAFRHILDLRQLSPGPIPFPHPRPRRRLLVVWRWR